MSTHKTLTEIKLEKQIEKLTDARIKVRIQIDCMSTDVAIRSYNRLTFHSRRRQLESALDSMQETIFFLQDMLQKVRNANYANI